MKGAFVHLQSEKRIDNYELVFEVYTNTAETELYKAVTVRKGKGEFRLEYPMTNIADLFDGLNPQFENEVYSNHLKKIESHTYHILSMAQVSGL